MRQNGRLNYAHALLGAVLFSVSTGVWAYGDEKPKEVCRNPKIQEFNLPEYNAPENHEVPPEAEFSFVVSGWADPKKIKVSAKGKPVPFEIDIHDTYHRIKGKIPAEFTGKFIRLDVRIPAVLGCYSTKGWLLKIAEGSKPEAIPAAPAASETPEKNAETTSQAPSDTTKPAASPEQVEAKPAATESSAPKVETKPEAPTATPAEPNSAAGSGAAQSGAGEKPQAAE